MTSARQTMEDVMQTQHAQTQTEAETADATRDIPETESTVPTSMNAPLEDTTAICKSAVVQTRSALSLVHVLSDSNWKITHALILTNVTQELG